MGKIKNKEQNKKVIKKIIIAMLILVFIFLISLLVLLSRINNEEQIDYSSISTVKEVIEFYKSTYISEQESEVDGFSLDIYAKLCYLPYEEDDTSNESYYTKLLTDISKIVNYDNFIIYDYDNSLTIKVVCDSGEISDIIINDIDNYFDYMDAQIDLKQYKEIDVTDFSITSNIINTLISNNWNSSSVDFGSRDSIFDGYNIYYDEGYKVRVLDGKVYNIIFTSNYKEDIIDSINVNTDFKTIEAFLGEPTFDEYNSNLIGYKGQNIYIFFTKNEVSIYRIYNGNVDEFFDLADKLLSDELDVLDFMNELTYLWPDYDEYEYSEDSAFISYPLKGIEISIGNSDKDGILVYNNIRSNLSKIDLYLQDDTFISRLKLDDVFEAEKRKYEKNNSLLENVENYYNNLSDSEKSRIGSSVYYGILPLEDSSKNIYEIDFVSKLGTAPDRQLKDYVSSFLWMTDRKFIYSKATKGIYLYDLDTGRVTTIISGTQEYKLTGYKDGYLNYDNGQQVQVN